MFLAIVVRVVMQDRFIVLPAVENADDGNHIGVRVEGDHCPLLVVGDAQAGPHVIASGAAKGKRAQTVAVAHDGFGVLRSNIGRCRLGDMR